METKTVKDLQTIAKERGLRGNSKLRKADLLAVLSKPADFDAQADKQLAQPMTTVNPKPALEGFDARADEQSAKPKSNKWYGWLADHVPIPAGWVEEQLAKPIKKAVSKAYECIADKVPQPVRSGVDVGFYKLKNGSLPAGWVDEQLAKPIKKAVSKAYDYIIYIADKVPQPVRSGVDVGFYKLENKINKLFNKFKNKPVIRESKSAIKGFAKQYVVDGIEGNDAATFLNNAKAEVVNLMGKNRHTKVNLVLCVKWSELI